MRFTFIWSLLSGHAAYLSVRSSSQSVVTIGLLYCIVRYIKGLGNQRLENSD